MIDFSLIVSYLLPVIPSAFTELAQIRKKERSISWLSVKFHVSANTLTGSVIDLITSFDLTGEKKNISQRTRHMSSQSEEKFQRANCPERRLFPFNLKACKVLVTKAEKRKTCAVCDPRSQKKRVEVNEWYPPKGGEKRQKLTTDVSSTYLIFSPGREGNLKSKLKNVKVKK